MIGGRPVVFELTLGALADLAVAFNTRNNAMLFSRLSGPLTELPDGNGGKIVAPIGPSVADLPHIVAALSNGAVSLDEARKIKPAEFDAIMNAIGAASAAAFPEDAGGNGDAAGTQRETPTATSPSTDISASPSLT